MTDYKGKKIGDYQVVDLLDDASNVLVFKGFQQKMNRDVVIKVLKPHAAKDQAIAQAYTQYAKLAATIQHPNILSVLDLGKDNNILYFVTHYLENKSVADNIPRFTDTNLAIELIHDLIPGLQYLYNKGYVHGNLRPTNILLDQEMQPLLTDFGFTFHQGKAPSPYNSPEQTKGGVVDQRTDVYALGVCLYELLVGHAPSPGASLNLRSIRPDVPLAVGQAILKATAQNPDQRFQTAQAFGDELINALKVVVPQTVVSAPQPQAVPQQAESKKIISGMGIVGGLLLGLLVFMLVLFVVPQVIDAMKDQPDPPPATVQPSEEAPIEPTEEPNPPTQDPPVDIPDDPPSGICKSLGLASGIGVMGVVLKWRKRKIIRP